MRLFLYGTLLDLRRLTGFVGRPTGLEPARLQGWRRVFLRHARYPTLRRAFRGQVDGAVVDVDARAFARLAAYEGTRYRLRRVAVVTSRGNTAAFAWIAPGATGRDWR